jgi:hypothetical protein
MAMARGTRTLLVLAVLLAVMPAAAWAFMRDQPDRPRIVLSVPPQVREGAAVTARLRALGAPAGSRAVVEVATDGHWRRAGAARVQPGRFVVSFELPQGVAVARVRALLLAGRQRLAASPVRSVLVRGGASSRAGRSASAAPEASVPPPVTTQPPAEPEPYEGPMYWGAWIDGAPWDWSKVTGFEAAVDKPLSLLELSSPFADCSSGTCVDQPFPTTPFEDIRDHGAIPFFSWGSQSIPGKVDDAEFQLADLIDGAHDEYIEEFAAAAAAWGHPFFLRFDWEMNGNWFSWGEAANGNQPGEFVAAWQHVHGIFAAAGATNVSWVWCPFVNPNQSSNIATDTQSFYPGDAYVDWTCLDGYNWGYHPEKHQQWRTFSYLFGPTYDEIVTTIAPGKPMLIGETASSEEGGSKAQWIEEMFAALPARFSALRGLIWFDVPDGGHDWPLSTSASAEDAFAAGVSGSRWLGDSLGELSTSPIPPPG